MARRCFGSGPEWESSPRILAQPLETEMNGRLKRDGNGQTLAAQTR
jgi:hypothetical protein